MIYLYRLAFYSVGLMNLILSPSRSRTIRSILSASPANLATLLLTLKDQISYHASQSDFLYRWWLQIHASGFTSQSSATIPVDILILRETNSDGHTLPTNNLRVISHNLRSRVIAASTDHENNAPADLDINAKGFRTTSFRDALNECRADFLLVTSCHSQLHEQTVSTLLAETHSENAGLIYCDEDHISGDRRHSPRFKPEYDPILEEEFDQIGNTYIIRRTLIDATKNLGPAQFGNPRDLVSNLSISAEKIIRVPHVLVSNRRTPEPGATCPSISPPKPTSAKLTSRVSIVILTKQQPDLLKKNVHRLFSLYGNTIEIIVVNNGPHVSDTASALQELLAEYKGLRTIEWANQFNWSKMNNAAVHLCETDILLFMNDDMHVVSESTLEAVANNLQTESTGIVGGLLVFPEGAIQHAGLVLGYGGLADHLYRGATPAEASHSAFVSPYLRRSVSAVTGAFMAIRKSTFKQLGGFNEKLVHCGDIDMCLKSINAGLTNVYDPRIQLVHYESLTRKSAPLEPFEVAHLNSVIANLLVGKCGDPYYNPNLSLKHRNPCVYI